MSMTTMYLQPMHPPVEVKQSTKLLLEQMLPDLEPDDGRITLSENHVGYLRGVIDTARTHSMAGTLEAADRLLRLIQQHGAVQVFVTPTTLEDVTT